MPLPAALQARLAKRGLLQVEEAHKGGGEQEEVEEVFAEDYDDLQRHPEQEPQHQEFQTSEQTEEQDQHEQTEPEEELSHTVSACPNRSNPYHECSEYCRTRWGNQTFQADEKMIHKRDRMIRKYPLPPGWKEVGDPETGRYYYWNTETDQISWLAPLHPRATILLAANRVTELLNEGLETRQEAMDAADHLDNEMEVDQEDEDDDDDQSSDNDSDTDDDDHDFEKMEREVMQEKRRRDRKGREIDSLDPMDPASYSDIARGTWSTGLDQRGKAKTGADTTASGPLFQQRPYPSPGAVLRANKGMSDQSGKAK